MDATDFQRRPKEQFHITGLSPLNSPISLFFNIPQQAIQNKAYSRQLFSQKISSLIFDWFLITPLNFLQPQVYPILVLCHVFRGHRNVTLD